MTISLKVLDFQHVHHLISVCTNIIVTAQSIETVR